MSEILAIVHHGRPYGAPTHRVRCAGCARIYVTTAWRGKIESLKASRPAACAR